MHKLMPCLVLAAVLVADTVPAVAALTLRDDAGVMLALEKPAARIVSLAPNVTELLFAAGAQARVVAVSEYSDYPPAAAALPRVGNAHALDLEAMLALKPDLVIAWKSGNDTRQLARLAEAGIPVFQ